MCLRSPIFFDNDLHKHLIERQSQDLALYEYQEAYGF